jgi:hypothetical protein
VNSFRDNYRQVLKLGLVAAQFPIITQADQRWKVAKARQVMGCDVSSTLKQSLTLAVHWEIEFFVQSDFDGQMPQSALQ